MLSEVLIYISAKRLGIDLGYVGVKNEQKKVPKKLQNISKNTMGGMLGIIPDTKNRNWHFYIPNPYLSSRK